MSEKVQFEGIALSQITEAGRSLGLAEAAIEALRMAEIFQTTGDRVAFLEMRILATRLNKMSDDAATKAKFQEPK